MTFLSLIYSYLHIDTNGFMVRAAHFLKKKLLVSFIINVKGQKEDHTCTIIFSYYLKEIAIKTHITHILAARTFRFLLIIYFYWPISVLLSSSMFSIYWFFCRDVKKILSVNILNLWDAQYEIDDLTGETVLFQ